jgi:predicted HTH transcriptional regulator
VNGVKVTDHLLQSLASRRDDGRIQPMPAMNVAKIELDGVAVAVVEVLPSDGPPVRASGRVWVRVGPRRALASAEEERRLSERNVHGARTFDRRFCGGAALGDLLLTGVEETQRCEAVGDGALVRGQYLARQHLRQVERLEVPAEGLRFEDVPDYPVAAIRELALNAVMHRSYEGANAPVRISWFTDRVEIQNPGGLYGHVTPQNFGRVPDYRNPVLAEAMSALGYVEKYGTGVARARDALARNGNPPPEFTFEPEHFLVVVRERS